jgi:hypothetical protein
MEKPPASFTHDVESHSTPHQQHGGGLPAPDDSGNVDDPPPIPSAGSSSVGSVLLKNEKEDVDGARRTNNSSIISIDPNDGHSEIHARAHTLPADTVASILGTDTE